MRKRYRPRHNARARLKIIKRENLWRDTLCGVSAGAFLGALLGIGALL